MSNPIRFVGVMTVTTLTATTIGGDLLFENVTETVGLSSFRAQSGDGHGPGAVFTDLDRDGYPDLYLMRAWGDGKNSLFLNAPGLDGARRFEAADELGAGDPGPATGAIAGDYDNDGDLDLYVINFDAPNALLQNRLVETGGALSFVDVTASTDPTPGESDDQFGVGSAFYEGIALDNSLTAAWGDPDRDGDLDLYVGNHNGWYGNPIEGPYDVPGRRDVYYRNNGDGTFTDVTMTLNVPGFVTGAGAHEAAGQRFSSTNAVIFADFDNDLWPDLLVTNKIGGPIDRDMLYRNRGADADGVWLGFAVATYAMPASFGHRSGAAMGVDVGDPDRDGDLDIYITDWSNLKNPSAPGQNDLWVNQLSETGTLSFLPHDTLVATYSWGTVWQDLDNDGWEDLHVATQAPTRDVLYRNTGDINGLTMDDVSSTSGIDQSLNARTSVSADYDRDGRADLFVAVLDDGPSILFENRTAADGRHFLSVALRGDPGASAPWRSTRDAIGARLTVIADTNGDGSLTEDERQIRGVRSGSSNSASTNSLELEVGLGLSPDGTAEILWPSGRRTLFFTGTDRFITIDEATLRTEDVNADGAVNGGDLTYILSTWGACPEGPAFCPADFDGDAIVGFDDLRLMLSSWGT